MTTEEMQRELYRLYQLDWMSFHGYSVLDVSELIANRVAERIRDEVGDPYSNYDVGQGRLIGGRWYDKGTDDIIEEEMIAWEKDEGFDGSIWACLDEFLDSEYKSASYIYDLTSGTRNKDELRKLYLEDIDKNGNR